MTTQMQRALMELSVRFDVEPAETFRHVLGAISDLYGGTMAMLNVVEGESVRFREVVRPHRLMRRVGSIPLGDSY